MTRFKQQGEETIIVIKPIWWRQLSFTLFLFLMAGFFAILDFDSEILDYGCIVLFGTVAFLNLFDQLITWSRLRIAPNSYSLRSWFRNLEFRREEVEDFLQQEFLRRPLVMIKLTESAVKERRMSNAEIPFPCTFGRPAEEVLETLRNTLPKVQA